MMFKACENCSKKVSESNGGSSQDVTYVCKPCNTHTKNFNWRYVLNVGLADFSGHHWATIFDSVACKLLRDVSAGELHEAMNNDHKRFDQLLQSSKFCRWRLKVRAKVEMWQKETRLKLIVIECDELQQAPENE
ncbi:Replication protein A subunit [Caligus rogercresseyi]|uniref:Replication protein A subunit n=1 Tax=Caligus rogercresseyi TaxID=217165 RepID=A0A7T8HEN0_CALRO|nr:Replication protein A subunit [Caligus rogercresseyi]